METTPVNPMRSESDGEHEEDKIVPKEQKDLEIIESQENESEINKADDDLPTWDDVLIGKENKVSSGNLWNKESLENSPDELKTLFGDVRNLKPNSKIEIQKQESIEALNPETNTGNVKSPLKTEGKEIAPTNVIVKDLIPLRFHNVHGEFLKISDDHCTVHKVTTKDEQFSAIDKYFVFSSRPVAINEKVYLRLETVSRTYIDPFFFGFSDCDPNIIANRMPDDMFNCLIYVHNNFGTAYNTFYFFVNPLGQVCYRVNGKNLCCLPKVINVNAPLWVLITLPHNVSAVKIMEPPKENEIEDLKSSNVQKPSLLIINPLATPQKVNPEYDIKQDDTKPTPEKKTDLEMETVPKNKGSVSTTHGGDLGKDGHAADAKNFMKIPEIKSGELKKVRTNIGNLKLNSTTETEKPASTEPPLPEANTETVNSLSKTEGSGTVPTNVAVKDLTPLRFHRVHGKFIKMSNDFCAAQNIVTKDSPMFVTHEGFVFSSRPIAINEKVFLSLEIVLGPYLHPFGFGFTDCDPNIIGDLIPRLCPLRTCIFSDRLNDLPNFFNYEDNTRKWNSYTFYFFVKPSGKVCYGINDIDMGCLPHIININTPLWAMIRLTYNVPTVILMVSPKENKSEDTKSLNIVKPSPSTPNPFKENIDHKEHQNNDLILKSPAPASGQSPEKPGLLSSSLTQVNGASEENLSNLRFHLTHGNFVKISAGRSYAKCEIPVKSYVLPHKCYAFSSRPIDIHEKVYLNLETVSKTVGLRFGFGVTECDPGIIPNVMSKLCEDSDCIFRSKIFPLQDEYCAKDNYLHFYVNQSGEIHFGINDQEKGVCLKGVNTRSRFWAVIQLSNSVSSVRLERKKPDFLKSFFAREGSSSLNIFTTETSCKITKSDGEDEKKNFIANSKIFSEEAKTEITNKTKEQRRFHFGVRNREVKYYIQEVEKAGQQISGEVFNPTLVPSTSNTPAKQILPTSSTKVERSEELYNNDVLYFAKILEYQLCRIPEHKKTKCMQNILEVIENMTK